MRRNTNAFWRSILPSADCGPDETVEKSPDSPKLAEYAEMLFDQALLAEGSPIPDPALFAKRAANLMTLGVEKEI